LDVTWARNTRGDPRASRGIQPLSFKLSFGGQSPKTENTRLHIRVPATRRKYDLTIYPAKSPLNPSIYRFGKVGKQQGASGWPAGSSPGPPAAHREPREYLRSDRRSDRLSNEDEARGRYMVEVDRTGMQFSCLARIHEGSPSYGMENETLTTVTDYSK
jgi:hypothetical protein